jgi:hypothetical protein
MSTSAADRTDTRLKRALGPGLLTLFVVGDVLGAGIYTLVGEAAGRRAGRCGWPCSSPSGSRCSPRRPTPSW